MQTGVKQDTSGKAARKKRETHPRRRDSLIGEPRCRIGVLRRRSGIVAISSVNPRASTSNYPLIVPKPSQGAPRLRTIDSHGNEGESRGREEWGKVDGGWGCSGWSRDGDAPSSSNVGCCRDNDTSATALTRTRTHSLLPSALSII